MPRQFVQDKFVQEFVALSSLYFFWRKIASLSGTWRSQAWRSKVGVNFHIFSSLVWRNEKKGEERSEGKMRKGKKNYSCQIK